MRSPSWIRAARSGPGWGLTKWARGEWRKTAGFSLPSPSFDFCTRPLIPGSARLKNPRWRPITERNGFSAMKPPVTACNQVTHNGVSLKWTHLSASFVYLYKHAGKVKGAVSRLNGLKSLAWIFQFRCLSSVLILSILNHPCSFMVYYYLLVFFYLVCKVLFSGFLSFQR